MKLPVTVVHFHTRTRCASVSVATPPLQSCRRVPGSCLRRRHRGPAASVSVATPPPPSREAKYRDQRVCLSACLSVSWSVCHVSRDQNCTNTSYLYQNFVRLTYVRGYVLLCRRSNTLCTSGLWMTSYLRMVDHMKASRGRGGGTIASLLLFNFFCSEDLSYTGCIRPL